jgi:ABC-type multidrug transport system ATPase subunit
MARETEQPALFAEGLATRRRAGASLHGIDLDAYPGEIISVFGPLGSGKALLLQVLSGRNPQASGRVQMSGAVHYSSITQDGPRAGTIQQWVQKQTGSIPSGSRIGRVTRALETLGLFAIRDLALKEAGPGLQRAAQVAGLLASGEPIVLIDSLLDGLPDSLLPRAWKQLRERADRESAAIVVSTVKSDVAIKADRTLLLDGGRALAFAPPEDLLKQVCAETITIEAENPALVQGTLRGIFDVEIEETEGGVVFAAADATATAAQLFRHPPAGVRAVYIRKPTLWDVHAALRSKMPSQE